MKARGKREARRPGNEIKIYGPALKGRNTISAFQALALTCTMTRSSSVRRA